MARPHGALTEAERSTALSRSMIDGALYALMVGVGETYFIAQAVDLGAAPVEVGLVVTLPLLVGSMGSLLALGVLGLFPCRRSLVATCAFLQAVVLVTIASLGAAGVLIVPTMIGLVCLYHLLGQAAGMAWSSWYGDVVPEHSRGRYFARRNRLVHSSTFVGLLAGGVTLSLMQGEAGSTGEPGPMLGFSVIFWFAALCRVGSALVLLRSPEPRFGGLPGPSASLRYLATARGRNAWRVLLGGSAFHLATYTASPFFVPYMLDELRIGYAGYTAAIGVQVAAKVLAMPHWGRLVDRDGARRAFARAILLAAAIPLPWLLLDDLTGVLLAHAWSGFAWAGFEIAVFSLLLESTVRRTRPLVFAAHNVANGTGQLAGGLLGGGLVTAGGFLAAFGVSLGGRLLVAAVLPRMIRDLRVKVRGRAALRVVGVRPGGGIVHRPVLEPAQGAPDPELHRPPSP